MERTLHFKLVAVPCLAGLVLAEASSSLAGGPSDNENFSVYPASHFDLSHWKITLPLDEDGDGIADDVDTEELQAYFHPDFFCLDANGRMVFTTPNKATTTPNSANSRSELRQMLRGPKTGIGTKAPGNNFALAAHPRAAEFGAIGGRLEATLAVNHVPLNAGNPDNHSAYSVVVGQVHAGKDSNLLDQGQGFGWGNEPIKIAFKKWPAHATGSVFWTYERNLPGNDPNRVDIAYPVWGNVRNVSSDPGRAGIALGEEFSFTINIHQDTAYLAFSTARHDTVRYEINFTNNLDAHGNPDSLDHPRAYAGDWMYFKAGAYNQCTALQAEDFPDCGGTGDWPVDQANGDYASVTFSRLVLDAAEEPGDRP